MVAPILLTRNGDGPAGAGVMSCGLLVPSRLVTLIEVLLGVVSAKLTGPSPVTADDTSTVSHVPRENGPVVSSTAPTAGALL